MAVVVLQDLGGEGGEGGEGGGDDDNNHTNEDSLPTIYMEPHSMKVGQHKLLQRIRCIPHSNIRIRYKLIY